MSQFNSVILRQSSTTGIIPDPVEVLQGELAVNLADGRLFTKDGAGTIVTLSPHSQLQIGPISTLRSINSLGTTTNNQRVWYGNSLCHVTGGTLNVTANRVYFLPIHIPRKGVVMQSMRTTSQGNGTAGNVTMGLYADNGSGQPAARLASTASIAVATGTAFNAAAVTYTFPNAGWYWMAAVFSTAPTMGAADLSTQNSFQGYRNWNATGRALLGEFIDNGSYALPDPAGATVISDGNNFPWIEMTYTA